MTTVQGLIHDAFEHPVQVLRVTGEPGSHTLAVLAGVHGDEPEGVVAARRLLRRLETMTFSGTVLIVPIACPSAYLADTRRSTVDDLDLARSFSGDSMGSDTQRIAHFLTESVIGRSTMLIDLHSSGRDYEMPLFAGAYAAETSVGARSTRAAVAFGAPRIWLHDSVNAGRSIAAAVERDIPAIYVETGGGGNIRPLDIDAYVDGTLRVMRMLGMVPADTESSIPAAVPEWLLRGGSGDIDAGLVSPVDGWCMPRVEIGQCVVPDTVIMDIITEDGACGAVVPAGRDGAVWMLRRRARVSEGTLLALIAPTPQPFRASRVVS